MTEFGKFALGVFKGLGVAIRTDIDVFLMTVAGLALSNRITRGLGIAIIFYLGIRRGDQWMKVYVNLKRREIAAVKGGESL